MSGPGDSVKWHELEGCSILVGLTVHDHNDEFLRREQLFGRIVAVDERRGISVALEGSKAGETLVLPPDLGPVRRAAPGEYRLKSTGEVVSDPDLLATWIKKSPPPDWKPPEG